MSIPLSKRNLASGNALRQAFHSRQANSGSPLRFLAPPNPASPEKKPAFVGFFLDSDGRAGESVKCFLPSFRREFRDAIASCNGQIASTIHMVIFWKKMMSYHPKRFASEEIAIELRGNNEIVTQKSESSKIDHKVQ